jgi:3-hydroxybutyryl-CoA dehydrogenase
MNEPIIERVEEYALSKKDKPKAEFSEIGIVGCGTTGQRLAIMIASRGMEVIFLEVSQEKIDQALREIEKELDYKVKRWGITPSEKKAIMSRIHGTLDYADFKNCDLVIESILSSQNTQSLEIRKEIFKKIEENVSPSTIIATNSTTIAITELASVLEHKDRCISMHISTVSPDASLVEVVKSMYTTEKICNDVQKFAILLGKSFVRVAESPGLITVRLFAPMINEACDILMERIADMENIDFAAKKSMNLFYGPFEMADKIGIDRLVRWLDNMYAEFGDLRYKASPLLRRLNRAKMLGRKTGKGFYEYDERGKKVGPALTKYIF